jgi:cytochrome oxidase Cu insertion factor (SCO1/SenC/PrrC family)
MQKNTLFLVTGVLVIALVLIFLLFLLGGGTLQNAAAIKGNAVSFPENAEASQEWKAIPIRDVNTSRIYRIQDLAGKPVLLFSFTTWCSICTAQQAEITRLQKISPDTFVAVGIDIDPYENDATVRKHQSANQFYGLYSVAPVELTHALNDEFGVDMITPSSAPMLLICSNGTVTRLERGIKSAESLSQAIRTRC